MHGKRRARSRATGPLDALKCWFPFKGLAMWNWYRQRVLKMIDEGETVSIRSRNTPAYRRYAAIHADMDL